MQIRVDRRGVLDRVADLVDAAEFDMAHPGEPVERCECGATLLKVGIVGEVAAFVCAGCGMVPTYRIHPASGEWERGVSPETSAADPRAARKGADAPGGPLSASGSGVLGRAGWSPRSLRLLVFAALAAFWMAVVWVVA